MSTHQQLLYHIVFATRNRQRWLTDDIREPVFAYMAGIARAIDGIAIEIGGIEDHVHLLVRIPARMSVADFVRTLKANSSKHINETWKDRPKFSWQDGYGVFTVSPSNLIRVQQYIANQREHHLRSTFQDEYLQLLKRHQVEFDPRYLFE